MNNDSCDSTEKFDNDNIVTMQIIATSIGKIIASKGGYLGVSL